VREIKSALPDWIRRQASLGPNVEVQGQLTEENYFWYLLTVCCPLIFESYAIVLHPFWINWKARDLINSGLKLTEEQMDETDFKRINWKDFFPIYLQRFELETANVILHRILRTIQTDIDGEWPEYIWFPSEGDCAVDELKFVFGELTNQKESVEANFYYCLLKTAKWNEERIFKGDLSEFDDLGSNPHLWGSPTAIFPDDKSWCIISDYDLPFTYIGARRRIIDSLVRKVEFDIYRIEPRYLEK